MVLKKGGKKGKKGKNNTSIEKIKRKLLFKEDEQEYCQITKLLGNCRVEGNCCDGKTRLCIIRGGIKKKMRIVVGSVVIVSLRDFEDGKCDIIHKYQSKEVNRLKMLDEIPKTVKTIDDLEEKEEDIEGYEEDAENNNQFLKDNE